MEPLQTGTPENRKPLQTEQFFRSRISVLLFQLKNLPENRNPSTPKTEHIFGNPPIQNHVN